MKPTPETPRQRIERFLSDPGAHFAAQDALRLLLYGKHGGGRDIVDAANDAGIVARLIADLCREEIGA